VKLHWADSTALSVGTLFQPQRGSVVFEFDKNFLSSGLSISPFKLPLQTGIQLAQTENIGFGGLFGVFADSIPDGWGLLLMARGLRPYGLTLDETTVLDRLAYIGSRGMGALVYEPAIEAREDREFAIDLLKLSRDAQTLLTEMDSKDFLSEIISAGGSPGGARPKIVVAIESGKIKNNFFDGQIISSHQNRIPENFEHWIIKFRGHDDSPHSALEEFLYTKTAEHVGIGVEPCCLFKDSSGQTWFGMKRFDRPDNGTRLHQHSLAGLLHANFRLPCLDYEMFLKATHLLTRSVQELEAAFRLAVFNAVFHNRDDHAKNFSFLMDRNGNWKLAPAYDLTWSAGPGGEHTTSYVGEGRNPEKKHYFELAAKSGIGEKRATEIIEEVESGKNFFGKMSREIGFKPRLKFK